MVIIAPPGTDTAKIAETIGPILFWLDEEDPRPAAEQLDENYQHGGGWSPFKGFKLLKNGDIQYPGDEPLAPICAAGFRRELLLFYPFAWVMIMQKNGTFEICRMD
jgi:hypothetical protein